MASTKVASASLEEPVTSKSKAKLKAARSGKAAAKPTRGPAAEGRSSGAVQEPQGGGDDIFLDEAALLSQSTFKIPPDQLIQLAKEVLRQEVGEACTQCSAGTAIPPGRPGCSTFLQPEPSAVHSARTSRLLLLLLADIPPAPPPPGLLQVHQSDRLAEDFEFTTPFIGPLDRGEFRWDVGMAGCIASSWLTGASLPLRIVRCMSPAECSH